jgi:hypothetical protein
MDLPLFHKTKEVQEARISFLLIPISIVHIKNSQNFRKKKIVNVRISFL